MTRINFEMADILIRQVDEMVSEKGFANRSEFFRYLVIEYMKNESRPEARAITAPEVPLVKMTQKGSSDETLNLVEKEITGLQKKLDEIVEKQGLEYGIPAEAVGLLNRIAELESK